MARGYHLTAAAVIAYWTGVVAGLLTLATFI